MSDVMLFGVLRMPYEMAMSDELSRYQFWQRAQEAASRMDADGMRIKNLLGFIEYYASCPCCNRLDKCEHGCTFAEDAPSDALVMEEARKIISATQPPQDERGRSRIPFAGYDPNFCPGSNPDNPQPEEDAEPAQPVALSTLTDEQILHRWDAYVGEPTPKRPLTDADKLAFARAILAASTPAQQATPPQPVAAEGLAGDSLIRSAQALLNLDAAGALAPHGIGGHARTIIQAFINQEAMK